MKKQKEGDTIGWFFLFLANCYYKSNMFSFLEIFFGYTFLPEPIYTKDLFDGRATIIVFGASRNWSYKGETREEIERNNPGITDVLLRVMRKYKIKRALVPKPVFNAKVVMDRELQKEILPNFFRGADADGVILTKPGDAYFLASADCLCASFYDPQANAVAALHCGRDALVDRKRLNDGEEAKRLNESVVDAAIELVGHKKHRDQIFAYLAVGIRPDMFEHPTVDHQHALENKRMIDHLISLQEQSPDLSPIVLDQQTGKIDLFELVRHQLMAHGIKHENIQEDEFDTATSQDKKGNFLLHSNRRDKTKRNLVIVRFNNPA